MQSAQNNLNTQIYGLGAITTKYEIVNQKFLVNIHSELEITVDHWPFSDHFQDLAEQIQFATVN